MWIAALGSMPLLDALSAHAATCGPRLELGAEYYVTAVPATARCVATGDWNEDGRTDVAIVSYCNGCNGFVPVITTLLGEGDFRLGSRTEIPEDVQALWVVARDMNGDGHLDLVVTGVDGTLVLAGDGHGAFHESERFPDKGFRAAVGDLDGDGVLDIVLAFDRFGITIRYRGTGEVRTLPGTFSSVVLADFDHDGDLDLAANGTFVWLNDGHGGFGEPTRYTSSFFCDPPYIASGDVNGDGNLDLVGVTEGDAPGGSCRFILMGRGDGTFQQASSTEMALSGGRPDSPSDRSVIGSDRGPAPGGESPSPGPGRMDAPIPPEFVVLADLDGDGSDDIVTIGQDRGREIDARQRSVGGGFMACVADMDQDGKLDLIVAGYDGIAIHPGLGDGSFRSNVSAGTYYPPRVVKLVDLDGDGRRDAAMLSDEDELLVVLTASDGGFGRIVRTGIDPSHGRIEFADFDGDGRPDLIADLVSGLAHTPGGPYGIYFGNGDGTFRSPPIPAPFGLPGDFDEDGRVDIATIESGHIRIMLGNGDGTFRSGAIIDVPVTALLTTVDVDHDGHLDLVITALASQDDLVFHSRQGVFVIFGRGDGTAGEMVQVPTEGDPGPVTLGDLDGDGRLDVIGARAGNQGGLACLNRGHGFVPVPSGFIPMVPAIGDLDGDGHADLMAGGVWFGHGDGTFEPEPDARGYGPSGSVVLADRNGDGLADALVYGTYDDYEYENLLTLIPNLTHRNRPPNTAGARASITNAWPPDGGFAAVTIMGVTDPDGDAVTITCVGVTQDEPLSGGLERPVGRGPEKQGSGCVDAMITPGGDAMVRLARDGSGNGRAYEITYSAADDCGASTTGRVTVCVPHDAGKPCVDDGQRFNSLDCGPAFAMQATESARPLVVDRLAPGRWSIRYALAVPADIQLDVFDLLGRRIASLESGRREAGSHERAWAPARQGGVFFVRLTAGGRSIVRRCVVLD